MGYAEQDKRGPEPVPPVEPEPEMDPFRFECNFINSDGEPELEQDLNLAIEKALLDCERRAGLDKERVVTMKLFFKPIPKKHGAGASRVIPRAEVDIKVPRAGVPANKGDVITMPIRVYRDDNGQQRVSACVQVMNQPEFLPDDL